MLCKPNTVPDGPSGAADGMIKSARGKDATIPSRVEATILDNLFDRLPWTLTFNLIMALCTLTVFAGKVAWNVLLLWFAAMIGTIVLRLFIRSGYLHRNGPQETVFMWRHYACLGTILTGAVWGFGGVVFYDSTSSLGQVYWAFVLACISAGSMIAQAGCITSFVGFNIAALLPFAARLAAEGDAMHLVLAGGCILYMAGASVLGSTVSGFLIDSARLATTNECLTEHLAKGTRELALHNTKLEQMVAERTKQLKDALDDAKRTEASRRRMLADVSHELRTPLTIIRGEAEIALRGAEKTPMIYKEALARTKEAAVHTALLVDDLLFIARSENGFARLRIDDVDLKALISELTRHANHSIPVISNLDEAPMQGDKNRLRQALLVLLENARQHGDGPISIDLDQSTDGYRISVTDGGPGMSEGEKREAFQRFFRGPDAARRYPEGVGLGLPVARAIIEAHGGIINLEDRPGGGLISIITLPGKRWIKAAS